MNESRNRNTIEMYGMCQTRRNSGKVLQSLNCGTLQDGALSGSAAHKEG